MNTDLELHAEIVPVVDQVRSQEVRCGAVFNDNWCVGLHGLTERGHAVVGVKREYLPSGVVDVLGGQANFLVAGKAGEDHWRNRAGVQVALLVDQVRIRAKLYSVAITNHVVARFLICFLNYHHVPCHWSQLLVSCSRAVSLLVRGNLVGEVEAQHALCLLVLQHHAVAVPQAAVR